MLNLDQAPRSGRVLAYKHDGLVYDGYSLQDGVVMLRSGEALDLQGAYELHLFDGEAELRAFLRNGEWDQAMMLARDEVEDDDHFVFSETQFVRECYWAEGPDERIVVNNRFSFDENGFLRLMGYRLATEAAK